MPDNNTLREFSYSHPIKYKGVSYPSASANILIDGQQTPVNVFADANGNYFVLGDNDTVKSVMPIHSLDEVVVTPSKENLLSTQFNEYLTQNNDQTQIFNTPHREYNSHLRNKAIKGALSHNLWEKEHPNLSAWSQALSAVPFAVASTPLVGALGQSALATTAGQTARAGIASLMSNPIVDAANTGLGLGFAAKGAYDVSQGKFTPETAMDLAGGAGLMFKSLTGLDKARRARKASSIVRQSEEIPSIDQGTWEDVDLSSPLENKTQIPIDIKADAAQRYTNFINSEDYQHRLQRAGLEDHWSYMKNLTNRRVNSKDYFPGKVKEVINKDPEIAGQSDIAPLHLKKKFPFIEFNPEYGITLRRNLSTSEIQETLDHEIAHWATGNAGIYDEGNMIIPPFIFRKGTKNIGDIMRYNESIVPNIPYKNSVLKIDDYYYLITPQEKRARAYSVLQQIKNKGVSIDDFVDSYTNNGKIVKKAPDQLKQLGYVLSPENIKKYIKNFLSISMPVGMTIPHINKENK